jgi:conjugative transfer signal peptidase TraF
MTGTLFLGALRLLSTLFSTGAAWLKRGNFRFNFIDCLLFYAAAAIHRARSRSGFLGVFPLVSVGNETPFAAKTAPNNSRPRAERGAHRFRFSRALLILLAFFSAGIALLWWFQYRFNFTDSMPLGLYRVVDRPFQRGDFVEVCLPAAIAQWGKARGYIGAGNCPDGSEPLLKQVAAVGGDTVLVTLKGVTVNGKRLPHSGFVMRDTLQRPMISQVASVHRVLPADEVWLYGVGNYRSWDSRYFGAVKRTVIRHVVEPVWIGGHP